MTRSRRYLTEAMTDAGYANDLAVLRNSIALAESQLHNLKQAPRCVGLDVSENKTDFRCFKQEGAISI